MVQYIWDFSEDRFTNGEYIWDFSEDRFTYGAVYLRF